MRSTSAFEGAGRPGKAALNQSAGAPADQCLPGSLVERRQSFVAEHDIQCIDDVRRGVHQRAIEIENNGWSGDGHVRAPLLIGQLRRDLPNATKRTDLTDCDFQMIVTIHNDTPRKCPGYRTPAEAFLDALKRSAPRTKPTRAAPAALRRSLATVKPATPPWFSIGPASQLRQQDRGARGGAGFEVAVRLLGILEGVFLVDRESSPCRW